MTTLRIEHAITDYQLWRKAFDGFAEARAQAGVRSFAIRLPVDDPQGADIRRFPDAARLVITSVFARPGRHAADPDPRPPAHRRTLTTGRPGA